MGGDNAPSVTIAGAMQANSQISNDFHLTLVGDESIINQQVGGNLPNNMSICHAPETVTSSDQASRILKTKPDSSIVKGLK